MRKARISRNACSTMVSPDTPVPPITWTQRSATRNSASDTATFAMELSAVPSDPVSRTPAHQSIIRSARSEEHTSELQSLMRISYAVFCLKKKNKKEKRAHKKPIKQHTHTTRDCTPI